MRKLLRLKTRPTAVFALGNLPALGAICALREGGLAIPEDMSVIGFGDHPYANHLATPLTTVAQDCRMMSRLAFQWLRDAVLADRRVERSRCQVPTTLIQRSSVRTLE